MTTTRNTPRKEAILSMLEADYGDGGAHSLAFELGRPPFAATEIARYVDWFDGDNGKPEFSPDGGVWDPSPSTVQSFARTLRGMETEGLVVSVSVKKLTYNGIVAAAKDGIDCDVLMPRTCYFSARTYERDIAAQQQRQEAAEAEQARRNALTPAQRKAEDDAKVEAIFGKRMQAPARLPGDVIDGCITEARS
jgi:hypothetical protein